jgi:branched-chain amino acid transport system permease protein
LGAMMAATAENHRLTESSGIDTHLVQVTAFTIGSGIAGFAGALSTHYLQFISPDSYTFWESVSYLTMLVVGGRDGVLGSVIGVLVLTPLPELLRVAEGMQHIIYGAMLVLCLMFVPNGLASLAQIWRARRRVAKAGTAVVAEEAP